MPDEAETSEADLGAALANAVLQLGSRDVLDKGPWIGDLGVPESCAAQLADARRNQRCAILVTPARPPHRRLATAHLGVKGVVTVASHPVSRSGTSTGGLPLARRRDGRPPAHPARRLRRVRARQRAVPDLLLVGLVALGALRRRVRRRASTSAPAPRSRPFRRSAAASTCRRTARSCGLCRDHQETGATHPYRQRRRRARTRREARRRGRVAAHPASKAAKALGSTSSTWRGEAPQRVRTQFSPAHGRVPPLHVPRMRIPCVSPGCPAPRV